MHIILKNIALLFIVISFIIIFCNNSIVVKGEIREFVYVGGKGIGNYSSIQEAIYNSNQSDKILVYAGNYSENLIINRSISLIGLDKNNVTIFGDDGLYSILIKSSNVTISGFNIKKGNVGILLSGSDYMFCNITQNIITKSYEAIRMINTSNNNISNNFFNSNNNFGIVMYESSNNEIINNTFIDVNKAMFLGRWSNFNKIYKNNFSGYNYGIHLDYSFNNRIKNNLINYGDFGVYLTSSKYNNISYNFISCNNQIGIYTSSSDDNVISPNIFTNNNQDVSKKTQPPDIKTPGFELLIFLLIILFITFVKKYK
jgi:parallel beta-helix repeat protein